MEIKLIYRYTGLPITIDGDGKAYIEHCLDYIKLFHKGGILSLDWEIYDNTITDEYIITNWKVPSMEIHKILNETYKVLVIVRNDAVKSFTPFGSIKIIYDGNEYEFPTAVERGHGYEIFDGVLTYENM